MDASALLLPVFVMGLLTVARFVGILVPPTPPMPRAGRASPAARHTGALKSLPSEVVQVADNYNHLFEQPTLFYAVAISIAVIGHVDAVHVACAWIFTVLRIAHSLVQATINIVNIRLTLFLFTWITLAVMIVRELLALI